jgi:hypothetical protein
VELIEVWQDRLLVVLPATSPLSDLDVVPLPALADLPLRIVERRANPPLVDLVLDACSDAGFTPALTDHPDHLEHTLAAIAAGPASWTVIYEPHARMIRPGPVVFRPTDPPLWIGTELAVAQDATTATVAPLLRACALPAIPMTAGPRTARS